MFGFRAQRWDSRTPWKKAAICAVEQAIGPKYKLEGLRFVELPQPPDGDDDGSEAQAS
jgi:hypothetical protein